MTALPGAVRHPLPCYVERCQRTTFRALIVTAGWTGATVTYKVAAVLRGAVVCVVTVNLTGLMLLLT